MLQCVIADGRVLSCKRRLQTFSQVYRCSKRALSQLYCYTVCTAIGIIMSSVHLSVYNAVPFSVGVEGQKLYQRVPSRQFSINFFRHFCCKMNCLATNCTEKTNQRNATSVCSDIGSAMWTGWRLLLIIIIISLDEAKHKCQGRRRLQASQ